MIVAEEVLAAHTPALSVVIIVVVVCDATGGYVAVVVGPATVKTVDTPSSLLKNLTKTVTVRMWVSWIDQQHRKRKSILIPGVEDLLPGLSSQMR